MATEQEVMDKLPKEVKTREWDFASLFYTSSEVVDKEGATLPRFVFSASGLEMVRVAQDLLSTVKLSPFEYSEEERKFKKVWL